MKGSASVFRRGRDGRRRQRHNASDFRLDPVWIDLFSGDFDEEVHLSRVDDEVGIRVSDRQSGPCNVDHFVDAGFGQQIQARQK